MKELAREVQFLFRVNALPRSPDEDPDGWIPTRESLLSRIKRWDDQESWRDFFNTYWKLIYRAAIKAGLSDAEAQEVVQETVMVVAKKMEHFKYDPAKDSFKGWLLYLTRKQIAMQYRKRQRVAGRQRTADRSRFLHGRPGIDPRSGGVSFGEVVGGGMGAQPHGRGHRERERDREPEAISDF